MPKYTPTKEDTRSPLSPHNNNNNNGKSPKSPSNITKQPNRASFATPQYFPQKISKFSPKSASKAAITSAGKKKKFNFDNPKVKKLLDKLSKKNNSQEGSGVESSNLNRLKRLLFRKKNKQALQKDKENMETEYTFTECSDDANSLYFGTEMSSEGELSEEELDLTYGLDHLDNGIMMSPPTKRPSALAASSRSSIAFTGSNSERRPGLSLQHLFTKRREEQKRAEEIIDKFDIKKQLESEMSVADTIFGKWQRENVQ
ncbi:hypothetical protein C9374_009112 [Naegleria lovaniensis]|uniref:Uncharacterized protein n=1 Tax=Naegleria lovaniensis TaxID=51637 RepID=A0AA88GI36_NAELO|nr:uncharacterized protein C9374_009112 [Naegleria lovaniensis]KAG2377596.1 hypothetical protein C9374_009112 [Naegleria lovaniensis]